jgi:hypothetical protein
MTVSPEQAFIVHHSGVLIKALSIGELPKQRLSPVPPVLSGADQARFSPQLCCSRCFLQPNNSIASPRPLTRAPASDETRTLWQF